MNRQELIKQIKSKKSFLCVGLDPDTDKMPASLNGDLFEFNKQIIDVTAPYCVAYKPNLAFYEAHGLKGYEAYEKTVEYIKKNYPEIFIIADAKRGDIGNTSRMYAKSFFEVQNVDAVTVAPYMGKDSVTPFLGFDGHWVVVLALTSNPGSHDFQTKTVINEAPENNCQLFEQVLSTVASWGNDENIMFVVGATQGSLFADVRKVVPTNFLLVPGVGAQGGSLEEVAKYGLNSDCGLLVNSSRGIIHASNQDDFAQVAKEKAQELQQQMSEILKQANII